MAMVTLIVQLDVKGETLRKHVNPQRFVRAVQRVIELAKESDIEGAEVLDDRIGSVTVSVAPYYL